MWKVFSLSFLVLSSLSACAFFQSQDQQAHRSPENYEAYRVELINKTALPVRYRYLKLAGPDPQPSDAVGDPQEIKTLDIAVSFNELKAGASASLTLRPGTRLIVRYDDKSSQKLDREIKIETPRQIIFHDAKIEQIMTSEKVMIHLGN